MALFVGVYRFKVRLADGSSKWGVGATIVDHITEDAAVTELQPHVDGLIAWMANQPGCLGGDIVHLDGCVSPVADMNVACFWVDDPRAALLRAE